jgi:hypothetical protein
MMHIAVWLGLGLLTVIPLLGGVHQASLEKVHQILGGFLILAALVYVGFALRLGDWTWLGIELSSVLIYGGFYGLARRFSPLWLALGWLLHPVWDLFHFLGSGHQFAPDWYTIACISFDLAVATYIFYRVRAEQPQRA